MYFGASWAHQIGESDGEACRVLNSVHVRRPSVQCAMYAGILTVKVLYPASVGVAQK